MIVGCYVLHVYCEDCAERGEFTGPHASASHKAARDAGWIVRPDIGKTWCRAHRMSFYTLQKPANVGGLQGEVNDGHF